MNTSKLADMLRAQQSELRPVQPAVQPAAAAPGTSARKGRARILFVDDETRILRTLEALFKPHYDVQVAKTGQQAQEMFTQQHFHVIVSDQRMPGLGGLDGAEVLRCARIVSPTSMRMLLTGFADFKAILSAINDGEAHYYMHKPWNTTELAQALAEMADLGLEQDMQVQRGQQVRATDNVPVHILFLESGESLYAGFARETGSGTHFSSAGLLSASGPEMALDLMKQYAVGVIVLATGHANTRNLDFVCALKRHHPEIVVLAVQEAPSSDELVHLLNAARVWRVLMKPLQPRQLQMAIADSLLQIEDVRRNLLLLQGWRPLAAVAYESGLEPEILQQFERVKNWTRG